MFRRLIVAAPLLALSIPAAPTARADICPYPGVGMGGSAIFGRGFFCDQPTEINGSHSHCESGNFGLGGSFLFGGDNGNVGLGGGGIGGWSCTWRCPDGAMAPAPNPPGAWQHYLVPMDSTNWCKDHMTPNGFYSEPVLPTEGIPPAGESAPPPGGTLPPQPIPPPLPTQPPSTPEPPPPAPGQEILPPQPIPPPQPPPPPGDSTNGATPGVMGIQPRSRR